MNRHQRGVAAFTVPRKEPAEGRVLVHNHIRPEGFGPQTTCGTSGFRAWTQDAEPDRLEVCNCEWVPWISVHYRVKRNTTAE